MVLSAIVDITERKQREEGLRAALREKNLLLGEIHHRVKNNLQIIHSLLDLQAIGSTDPHVHNVLQEGKNRIRSMSLIHQTLYQSQDFANVDLTQFLDSLVPELLAAYMTAPDLLKVDIKADLVKLPIDIAIPCGLIINELVSNALKHAFPDGRAGKLWIELSKEETGMISLRVSNDGVPLPAEINFEELPTLGIRLVGLLADQLHGTFTMQRETPTSFTITFPST
jgi:two-component sensor histidine kinase